MMACFLVLNGNMDPLSSTHQLKKLTIIKKNNRKNPQSWTPLTKLSGFAHCKNKENRMK